MAARLPKGILYVLWPAAKFMSWWPIQIPKMGVSFLSAHLIYSIVLPAISGLPGPNKERWRRARKIIRYTDQGEGQAQRDEQYRLFKLYITNACNTCTFDSTLHTVTVKKAVVFLRADVVVPRHHLNPGPPDHQLAHNIFFHPAINGQNVDVPAIVGFEVSGFFDGTLGDEIPQVGVDPGRGRARFTSRNYLANNATASPAIKKRYRDTISNINK